MEAVAASDHHWLCHIRSCAGHCADVVEVARQLHFYRLHRAKSRCHCRTVARISHGGEQLFRVSTSCDARGDGGGRPAYDRFCAARFFGQWTSRAKWSGNGRFTGTSFHLLDRVRHCHQSDLSFMAPVMYRQRCPAPDAARQVLRLIFANPAPFILFCLFGIVLILAMLVIGCVVTCVTCCIGALPYLGTVILLPVFVTLHSFSLLFLRQFGPEYDMWTSFMPPEFSLVLLPLPAPPESPSPPSL